MTRHLGTAALVTAILLGGCGIDDSDDGASDAGTGSSGGGLAGLLKGFGKPGGGTSGQAAGDGGAANENTDGSDAGVPGGATGGGPDPVTCANVCNRIMDCVPEGGCPNYALLPASQREMVRGECTTSCGNGDMTDAQAAEVATTSCQEIYRQISAEEPGFRDFCALTPATDAQCGQFCDLIRTCNPMVTVEECKLTCFYGEAIACYLEAGTCQAPACAALFPSDE